MDNVNNFDDVWEKIAGESWSSCRTCTVPTDIFIDEAQILYGKADFFWVDIKGLLDDPNPNIRVLLLSMYSDRLGVMMGDYYTPIDFPYALGLECLHLKRTEFDQLVANFINFVFDEDEVKLTIPTNMRDAIFNFRAGHPQLLRRSLELLTDHFRRTDSVSDMLYYLASDHYYSSITQLRIFDAFQNLEMTDDNIKFLINAYHHVDSATFPVDLVDGQVYDAVQRF